MRARFAIATSLLSLATDALAAGNVPAQEGPAVLTVGFLGFCLVMGLFQVAPAMKLLVAKLRGRFHRMG